MPYVSRSQQRAFHAKESRGEISHAVVAEFDAATDFKHLPEHARQAGRKGQMTPDHKRAAIIAHLKRDSR